MTTVHFNSFAKRHTPDSPFSHFEGSEAKLIQLVKDNLDKARDGYRDGVCLVPVPPERFKTGVVKLKENDALTGSFSARRPGEEPRKHVYAKKLQSLVPRRYVEKAPAKAVDIVLYSHNTLAEKDEYESEADWEIVSINASPFEGELPIHPMTLIANHFELDGGTATNMSPEEFEAKLKESVLAWKDLALLEP